MKGFTLYKIILFTTLFFFSDFAFAQDSITNRVRSSITLDSAVQFNDSLRKDIRAVNISFLDNIHIKNINTVLSELNTNFVKAKRIEKSSITDSLAIAKKMIESDLSRLKSISNSLNNYKSSVISTQSALDLVKSKYQINNANYPQAFNYLVNTNDLLNLKFDSIESAQTTVLRLVNEEDKFLKNFSSILTEKTDSVKSRNSIWKSTTKDISRATILNNIKNNYKSSNAIDRYFNDIEWSSRIILLLLTIAYAYWCFKIKYDLDKKSNVKLTRHSIGKILGKAVIFYFTLLPLVSFFTPTFIIQAAQLILIGLYTWMSIGRLNITHRKILAGVILFYIMVVFVNMIVSDDLFLRVICILFNIIALFFVSYSKRKITDKDSAGYINNSIYVLFAILNVSAIILNIVGELETSRAFSIACAVGLVQSFTLQFFIEMIKEDLSRQFERDSLYKGFWKRFNRERTMKIIIELLKFTCVILAILVLANNLQFVDHLLAFSESVLDKKRKIGDISFTFGNLIIAIILILITNWLQKNISLIILGGDNGKLSQKYNQKMTLFPLFRLAIILVGFFFAISALGMGLDKLTVVIGALSVGIGLGMQNIINNFVSGIILVFDKPFRVGDQIELADKKGRVKEIGIRASVLQTADGADVIIPNGDLLSGKVVNWTLSHEYSKTSFTILVDKTSDLESVYKWIGEAAETSEYYLPNFGVSISVQDVSADMVYLSVVAWVNFASNAGSFKSDVFLKLYKKFESENLKFYSVAPAKIVQ